MKHSAKKQTEKAFETAELDALFRRLDSAAQHLNTAAEEAGRRIDVLEERLAAAQPGVCVWGPTLLTEATSFQREDRQELESAERVLTLGYAKVKKDRWGIAVREVLRAKSGAILSEDISLVSKAERTLRVAALPHLEGLTRQVVEALEAQAAKLQDLQENGAKRDEGEARPAANESAHN